MSDARSQYRSPDQEELIIERLTNQEVEEIIKDGGYLNFENRKPGYFLLSFRRPVDTGPLAINVITYIKK